MTRNAGILPAVLERILILPGQLQTQIASEARKAYPRECCGLIEGVTRRDTIEVVRLHPARNLAARPDRFEIDPMDQFRLMRALRDTEREIVGCYHSHPDGTAVPSPRDLEGASEENLVWVIAAVDEKASAETAAFAFLSGRFERLLVLRSLDRVGERPV